jgi:hypothetical protein
LVIVPSESLAVALITAFEKGASIARFVGLVMLTLGALFTIKAAAAEVVTVPLSSVALAVML